MVVLTRHSQEALLSPAFPSAQTPQGPFRLNELVQRRLDVARLGLAELRRRLDAGQDEDAALVLHNIDEDLSMLQCRLLREEENAAPYAVSVHRSEVHGGPRRPR